MGLVLNSVDEELEFGEVVGDQWEERVCGWDAEVFTCVRLAVIVVILVGTVDDLLELSFLFDDFLEHVCALYVLEHFLQLVMKNYIIKGNPQLYMQVTWI